MDGQTKDLLRILAPNPSPLTGPGTTTFLLGQEETAVIDPGPDDAGHLAAIRQAARGRISHIIVTHAHLDHSAGARRLRRGRQLHADRNDGEGWPRHERLGRAVL